MSWLRALPGRIGAWLGERFELEDSVLAVLRHPVPRALERPIGWWYVFGSATLAVFVVQVATGVGLAMTYVPAPNSAYDSLQFISHDATLGAVVRGMHYFGAGAMVVLVLVHMTQVYLFGSFKFPREANWLTGSLLLLATLAMAFTGQLLRWDQDAFWSIVVAAEQAAHVPVIGDWLARLVVAGSNVGGATLTRFYATHVFLIPAAVFGLIGLHLYLVIKRGISEPPVPGLPVDRPTYRARYAELLRRGIPFWPDAAWRDAVVAALVVAAIVMLAALLGAPDLGNPPDPTNVLADPRPDWYFLGYFALLAVIPPATEAIVIVGLPLFAFVFLFLVPLLWPDGERHWSRRPTAIAAVVLPFIAYAALTVAGLQSPWVPLLEGGELPAKATQGLNDTARRGATLFVSKGCWSCHQIEGSGGRKGPDLSRVASRLGRDQLTARIATGGGGMPSYAGSLAPGELDDLVTFLATRKEGAP
ncbi:MAG TPA: cytochrome b N-terminal domain-containing protein [Candidatus Limnocylindria bacterium]|jgi:ubiquinol-cytochrome c reductase cytochrome b subunit|nr:cytochrome b N-terminal domain-containing protein [Candidatus Limnocylindria bacterium]